MIILKGLAISPNQRETINHQRDVQREWQQPPQQSPPPRTPHLDLKNHVAEREQRLNKPIN